MEAVVPRNLVKTFTKAIVCLAKCGDEMFVEADTEKLLLRTVNSGKSAFLAFSFLTGFFERYEVTERVERCKILSKPLLSAFKSAVNAETVFFSANAQSEPRIVVRVTTKSGVVKTARLHYEDAEALQAVYSRESGTATVLARPRLLADCLGAFHKESEELTFTLKRNALRVRSYIDPAKSQAIVASGSALPGKAMQTELSVDARDFQEFGPPAAEAEIIFNVKELRAMLRFCEEAGQDVAMRAEGGGRPVLFSAHTNGPVYFEADLVVATLADVAASQSQQPSSASAASASRASGSARADAYGAGLDGGGGHADGGDDPFAFDDEPPAPPPPARAPSRQPSAQRPAPGPRPPSAPRGGAGDLDETQDENGPPAAAPHAEGGSSAAGAASGGHRSEPPSVGQRSAGGSEPPSVGARSSRPPSGAPPPQQLPPSDGQADDGDSVGSTPIQQMYGPASKRARW